MSPVTLNDSGTVIGKIDSVLVSISRLSCDWYYQKTVSILQEEITASGCVEIDMKSSVLRWDKNTPAHTELLFTPTDVSGTSVSKDNRQIYRRISKFVNSRVNSKTIADPKDFKRTVSIADNEYVIRMVPKSQEMMALFTEIELIFDKRSLLLKKIMMVDSDSDVTVITIKSIKTER